MVASSEVNVAYVANARQSVNLPTTPETFAIDSPPVSW
jgi:hypothetical protein